MSVLKVYGGNRDAKSMEEVDPDYAMTEDGRLVACHLYTEPNLTETNPTESDLSDPASEVDA